MVKTKSRAAVTRLFFFRLCCLLFFAVAGSLPAASALQMPSVFSDHMVLQREMPVPVWGTAEPGAQITVAFAPSTGSGQAGQQKTATAGADGKWRIDLDPLAASSEGCVLKVFSNLKSEIENRHFIDVLVGEVWLCSGQSNMYQPLGGVDWAPDGIGGAEQELQKPDQPMLRLFCDDAHPLWKSRRWQSARPETLRAFSGTAYFFGDRLRSELKVPVGLMNISRGGSPIQQWTPAEYNRKLPVTAKYENINVQNRQRIQEYNQALNACSKWNEKMPGPRPEPPAPLPEEIDAARSFYGSKLYETLIAPQVPFAIRGVIWYQGESNARNVDVARHYDEMLKALIVSWREKFENPDMPFYFVQLPAWGTRESEHWPWIRQGMLNVLQTVDHTGMAVAADLGDFKALHPPRKQPVGERLALWALARTYGKSCVYSGPLPREVISEASGLRIRFDTFGSGLKVAGAWKDLEVAGADRVYYPATATVGETDAAIVCPQVKAPVMLRYGWKGYFEPTLFNRDGLPATPFYFIRDKDGLWRNGSGAGDL